MPIRIAINGFGRIGRNTLRALYENGYRDRIQVVAINDLGKGDVNTHLFRFDTVHGRFNGVASYEADGMIINGDTIAIFSEKDPKNLPWKDLSIDIVFECTGLFTTRESSESHISAGASKVIVSAPCEDADATIVYGVNDDTLSSDHRIISNASCTTNCLAPIAKPLHDFIGIKHGLMTTIHSITNDQALTDVYHSDLRRARSATQSMIPTKTGAASAVGLVLPELAGKLDGMAIRVPVVNVSVIDFTFTAARKTSIGEINDMMVKAAARSKSSILQINLDPLVSIDFNHCPASAIFDCTQTHVSDNLVKVIAWYDNEWGFSNRMLDNAIAFMAASGAENNDKMHAA
ncbi:type I glyceraldehyde-3-phosphate dehydrogenase [Gammaproteobacteria bacterium 45_16_T64]|nr:type I glyceraldehyde-3-phosphate dehydrogenase [Gammaproteobacteria bacterium 45_16_T64]